MRKSFNVADPSIYTSMRLEALYDDGFNVWINGVRIANAAVTTNPTINSQATTTRENNTFATFTPPAISTFLRAGTNEIAVQFHNVNISSSNDAFFDCRLIGTTGGDVGGQTPGKKNANFAANARACSKFPCLTDA